MTDNVVDASIVVKWLVKEEWSDEASSLPEVEAKLIAPELLFAEVFNALWAMHRRGDFAGEGLSMDPTFRLIGSQKIWEPRAALTSTLHGFETRMSVKLHERVDSRGFRRPPEGKLMGLVESDRRCEKNLVHLAVLERKGRDAGYPIRKSQLSADTKLGTPNGCRRLDTDQLTQSVIEPFGRTVLDYTPDRALPHHLSDSLVHVEFDRSPGQIFGRVPHHQFLFVVPIVLLSKQRSGDDRDAVGGRFVNLVRDASGKTG